MITIEEMFDFIQWSSDKSYVVSQNKLRKQTYYIPALNGGIEFYTFKELFEKFKIERSKEESK